MLRYAVGLAADRALPADWPYGTFIVNMLGSLAMGGFVGWLTSRIETGEMLRLLTATGVLGGFTTFSAFSLEVEAMLRAGQMVKAAAYAGLSIALGVAALAAGLLIARRSFG